MTPSDRCPACNRPSKVTTSKNTPVGKRRYRKCLQCADVSWITVETVVPALPRGRSPLSTPQA